MNKPVANLSLLWRLPVLLAVTMVCALQAAPAGTELTSGLTFHASFAPDSPVWSGGRDQIYGEIEGRVEGISGVGVEVSSQGVAISVPGNFNYPVGTVSFWVRWPEEGVTDLSRSGQSLPERINLLWTDNFCLRYLPATNTLTFMTGTTVPDVGYKWDYQCAARPQAAFPSSSWQHLAITWDANTGAKSLYLNGRGIATSRTQRIRTQAPAMNLQLRFGGGEGALPLQFDEINLWDRVLSAEEIAALSDPAAMADYNHAVGLLPLPAGQTAAGVKAGLQITPFDQIESTIIAPGESFTVDVPVTNLGNRPVNGTGRLALENFFGEVVEIRELPLALSPNATQRIRQDFSPAEQGIYRVAFSFLPEGGTASPLASDESPVQDVASFVVWPAGARLSDDSWFGMHVNSWGGGHVVRQAARLGFRHNRNHNMLQATWWTRAQFDPGDFDWQDEDCLMANVEADMQVMGQFMGTPWWAALGGDLPRLPNTYPSGAVPRMDAFANYVTETVNHYKDRVSVWEIGNEPDVSMFWRGTPEQFAEYVRIAAERVRASDAQALVLGSGYASNDNFIRAAAEAGALRPLDGLSIHIYHSPEMQPELTLVKMEKRLAFFRDLLAKYTDKPDMPIYQSEGGSTSTTFLRGVHFEDWPPVSALPPMNWHSAAIRQVQSDALLLGLGFVSSYSYLLNPTPQYTSLSEEDVNNTPKPKVVARAAMAAFLDECTFYEHVRLNDDARLWAALFTAAADGSTRAVVWVGDDARVSVGASTFAADGTPAHLYNLMGAPVPAGAEVVFTEVPVFLSSPLSPEVFAERLKAAQFQIEAVATPLPAKRDEQDAPNVPALPDYAAALENPQSLFSIDLRPYANMGLVDEAAGDGKGGWADEGPYNDGRDIPYGRQVVYGVPFDVIDPATNRGKSIITLRGQRVTPTFPLSVEAIPINHERVRALYFLQTTAWGTPGHVGRYIIHYADGSTLDLPLDIGKNTANWWDGYKAAEASKPWGVRVTNTLDGKPSWRYLRVWEWENPKPDVPLASIDFVSAGSTQTPILLGITGVTW